MKKQSIIAAAMLLSTAQMALAEDKLRFATEGAYPPFNNVTADGGLVGFDVEIAQALCDKIKRDCEIVAQDWDGIIPGLVNNKYDAIVASMSITTERLQAIDFTDPYYKNYLSVVAKNGAEVSMDNLGKQTIGAQRSTIGSQWAEDNYGRRGDINLYDTIPAAFADLKAGRIDVVVTDFLPAADWIEDNAGYGLAIEKIDIGDKIGIGLRKEEDSLKGKLNAALKEIRADGTYQKISEKFFGTDIY